MADKRETGYGSGGRGNVIAGSDDLWILNLKVTAVSPIYTGENKVESNKQRKVGNKLPTRMSGDGFAVVNISGVIRAMDEKIYRGEGTCDVGTNAKGCGHCLTCDMFGSLGMKGRVLVDELKSVLPFNDVVMTAIHPRINRETGTIPNERGASLELEEIQEGTELRGRIIIKNPKDKDLEVLESAFKAMEEQGVGGWTRRGKGRVTIVPTLEKKKWSVFKEIGKEEATKLLGIGEGEKK